MATPTTLLNLPLEIRQQIYSYMLLNDCIIDMVAANVGRPQEYGLFLTCRQLHSEAFDYYYYTNTFRLSLSDPTYSPDEHLHGNLILTNRLGSMRNLHVEIEPVKREFVGATGEDINALRHVGEPRWRRFTQQLTDTHEGQVGLLLKSLVVIDRYARPCAPQYYYYSDGKLVQPPIALSELDERIMALTQLVEPLKDKVGKITIEIRSGYVIKKRSEYVGTPVVPTGDYPYKVLMSSAVPPHWSLQLRMCAGHSTAKLTRLLAGPGKDVSCALSCC